MTAMAGYPGFGYPYSVAGPNRTGVGGGGNIPHGNSTVAQTPQKDYSKPLHVDCSVEYELPNQPPPPTGRTEPLLMIHPCYYRREESQKHSPFVNNLPTLPIRTTIPTSQHPTSHTSMTSMTHLTASRPTNNHPQNAQNYQFRLPEFPIPAAVAPSRADAHQHQQQLQNHFQQQMYLQQQSQQQMQQQQLQHQVHHSQQIPSANTDMSWSMVSCAQVQQQQPQQQHNQQHHHQQQFLYPKSSVPQHIEEPAVAAGAGGGSTLCGGGDFSSGSDSGISAHWTDSERSPIAPDVRLKRDFSGGADSGVPTPVSMTEDQRSLNDLLGVCEGRAVGQPTGGGPGGGVTTAGQQQQQQHVARTAATVGRQCTCCMAPNIVGRTMEDRRAMWHKTIQRSDLAALQIQLRRTGWPAGQDVTAPAAKSSIQQQQKIGGGARAPWMGSVHGLCAVPGVAAVPEDVAASVASSATSTASCEWIGKIQTAPVGIPQTMAITTIDASGFPAITSHQQHQMTTASTTALPDQQQMSSTCIPSASAQQWAAPPSYYSSTTSCRGAIEDSARPIWNPESMLRLFQV